MGIEAFEQRAALQYLLSSAMSVHVTATTTTLASDVVAMLGDAGQEVNDEVIAPWVSSRSLGVCTSTLIGAPSFYLVPGAVFVCAVHRKDGNLAVPPFLFYLAVCEDGTVHTIGEPGND
jgi:hypothetical protein